MTKAEFSEIEDAYDYVSFGEEEMNAAYVSRETGKVYWYSDEGDFEELPGDIDDPEKYAAIPHRHDFDLGRQLVEDFVLTNLPDEFDRVASFFRRRGAYARYKDLLETKRLLQSWLEYENARTQEALKQWCAMEGIELVYTQPELTE